MAEMALIVGLGNPGIKYESTRHNIGFMAIDALAKKHGLAFTKLEHKAMVATGTINGRKVMLAKPQTFMNVSGESVQPLARFYKIEIPNLLVVCDDLDTPIGTVRMRIGGSSGGQNGLKHILERLGTQDINRLKLGISRPPGRMDPAAWVMTGFKDDDAITLVEVLDRAVKSMETWLKDGVQAAMTRHNGNVLEPEKPKKEKPPVSEGE